MNLLTQEIAARVATLPEQQQQEALDFIEFLQIKLARKLSRNITPLKTQQAMSDEQAVSPIYQAFEQAGLIGCIETDEQLSTTYKEKLDFSFKHGTVK